MVIRPDSVFSAMAAVSWSGGTSRGTKVRRAGALAACSTACTMASRYSGHSKPSPA